MGGLQLAGRHTRPYANSWTKVNLSFTGNVAKVVDLFVQISRYTTPVGTGVKLRSSASAGC